MTRMRIASLLLLLSLQSVAEALDFRGVEIGQTCRRAADVETSLGSTPRQDVESMVSYGAVIFEDHSVAGQRGQFLYNCRQKPGVISSYSIDIKTEDEPRARRMYAEAKADAVRRLGAPVFDSEAPGVEEKWRKERLNGQNWFDAVANWRPAANLFVSVSLEKDSPSNEWSVLTSVTEVPEESPNPSLERTREQ